jgi:Right handed beta helix region
MKRRVAVLLFAVVAAVGLCLAPAGAGESHHGKRRSLVVDDDFGRRHHARCRFGRARFATISEAVAEAREGQTVKVCPGIYKETVEVGTKGLTILGAKFGQDARDRSGDEWGESVVEAVDPEADGAVQLLESKITWDGFVIRGPGVDGDDPGADPDPTSPGMYTSPEHSGSTIRNTVFLDNGLGIHLGSDGERPTTICQNRFIANNEFEEEGQGSGIFSDQGAKDVLITDNRFEDHNTSAVLFADHPMDGDIVQERIRVLRNKSVDDLSFATFWATVKLRIGSNRVRARVGDPVFPGPASAIFIGARNDDVEVTRNRVESASGNGIDVTDSAQPGSGLPDAPTNVSILKNKVEGAQHSGIHMASGTSDVLVEGNTAVGNAPAPRNPEIDPFDCKDESIGGATAGTANTWEENVGGTASPAEICSPPSDLAEHDHRGKDDHRVEKHKKKQHTKHHKRHGKHDGDACGCGLPWRY